MSPAIVTYRDSDHTYWCRSRRYLSATQVLDRFKNKFDTEGQAVASADKYGATPEKWKNEWAETRDRSLIRGNTIHALHEEITLNRGLEMHDGKVFSVPNPALFPEQTPLIQLPDGIYTEQLLYHHGFGIAGRTDKVYLETIARERWANVDDYKTNRIIKMHAYGWPRAPLMMKGPIDHLEDCTIVHFALQTSLYMLMLEYMGFKPGWLDIIHFPHVPEMAPPGALAPPPVTYHMPYLKKEVTSMLNHLKFRRVI